jgi:hypothetical protein
MIAPRKNGTIHATETPATLLAPVTNPSVLFSKNAAPDPYSIYRKNSQISLQGEGINDSKIRRDKVESENSITLLIHSDNQA